MSKAGSVGGSDKGGGRTGNAGSACGPSESKTGSKETASKSKADVGFTGSVQGKKGYDQAAATKSNLAAKAASLSKSKVGPKNTSKLSGVNPNLASKVKAMAADLKKQGIDIAVVDGMRSFAKQNSLYAQGRTKPGQKVTNVKAGNSFHNYGLAVDVAPMKNGKIDWNAPKSTWDAIGKAGVKQGLEWGGNWKGFKDRPHFELDGGAKRASAYRDLMSKSGVSGVWNAVDRHYGNYGVSPGRTRPNTVAPAVTHRSFSDFLRGLFGFGN